MLRRLKLAAFVCFALLGVAAAVVWHWVRVDHSYPGTQETYFIAKVLGWKVPAEHRDFEQMVARNPLPVLQLLAHDSKRVRRWAELILTHYGGPDGLNDDLLNLISAELKEKNRTDFGYSQPALIRILGSAGERGAKRLALLYRSKHPIELIFHLEICVQVTRGRSRQDLVNALLEVVQDHDVLLENRSRAADALGNMEKPDDSTTQGQAANVASAKLAQMLPRLPESVASAARVSLLKIEAEPEDWEDTEPFSPGNWYVVSPAKDRGAAALAALKDKNDWLRTGHAAEKLARHGMKEAIPELQRVADDHWFGPTRKAAQQAVRILQGQEPLPPPGRYSIMSSLVMQYEDQDFDAWRKRHAPGMPPPRGFLDNLRETVADRTARARHAVFWRLQPRIGRVEYSLPGRLPVPMDIVDLGMNPMRPRNAFRFAGGKLLGYDEGEFGSGTVFYRRGKTPRFFSTANVQFFFPTPLGVMVYCEAAMVGERLIYLASEQPDGQVSVDFFMRLPNHSGLPEVLPTGEIMIPCVLGDIVISQTGEIRSVDHPAK